VTKKGKVQNFRKDARRREQRERRAREKKTTEAQRAQRFTEGILVE
jgi:hypothetical protein